jgi:hypothetical protein
MTRYLPERKLLRLTEASLILAASACLALWLARIFHAISFVRPSMSVTAGWEEACLFSIWRFTQHQAVYTDLYRIPFAGSYYNWGFYYFYGLVAEASLRLFHLDAVWIATTGRLTTAAFTLLSSGIFFLAQKHFVKAGLFANSRISWAWCAIAACSPLVAFSSITVRPDIGALAFECAGFYAILRYVSKPSARLLIAAAFLFYVAWAFKQTQVTMLAGSALALLLLKRWRAFLTISGIWWLLVIANLILGGPAYRESILFSQRHLPMLLGAGLANARLAGLRNLFLPLGTAAILGVMWRRVRSVALRPADTVVIATLLFSICFALVTSCISGGTTSYYVPAAWVAMLGLAMKSEQVNSRWILTGLVVCSLVMAGGAARASREPGDYRHQDSVHRAVAEKLSHLPGPAFVAEEYSNLPWVQRDSPHFVLAYAYDADRIAQVPFEDDGWEGLAREGYFGTLVLASSLDPGTPLNFCLDFDPSYYPPPSLLQKYELVDEFSDGYVAYKFYRRLGSRPR